VVVPVGVVCTATYRFGDLLARLGAAALGSITKPSTCRAAQAWSSSSGWPRPIALMRCTNATSLMTRASGPPTPAYAARAKPAVLEQRREQGLAAAPQVEHPAGADLGERCPARDGKLGLLVLLFEVAFQLRQCGRGEGLAVGQVAAGDQRLLRVGGEPALAGAQQLLDLARGHPVVLRVVQHRQEHVEVVERVGEPEITGEAQIHVTAAAALFGLNGNRRGRNRPAQRGRTGG
jgi:hypothetical protein